MVVRIRLTRCGKRNRPYYRIGIFDARTKRDGKAIEIVGHYDPRGETDEQKYTLDVERVKYWLSVGAQPTDTVKPILKKHGIALKK